jgi:hypothetical protein
MQRCLATLLSLLALGLACVEAQQGDDKLRSGPQPGEAVPGPFHYLNVNGAHAGKPHCLVCEHGLNPVAAVFLREAPNPDTPAASLLKKLDEAVARHERVKLGAFAVLLTDQFTNELASKGLVQTLERLVSSLDLKGLVLSVGGAAGPEKYNLNKDAAVTVLLYHEHKVVANFAFAKDKFSDKDVAAIVAAVDKMAPKARK